MLYWNIMITDISCPDFEHVEMEYFATDFHGKEQGHEVLSPFYCRLANPLSFRWKFVKTGRRDINIIESVIIFVYLEGLFPTM